MRKFLLIVLAVCPIFAQACSFAPGYERFTPAVAAFDARMDGERMAVLPAPQIREIHVMRGTAAPGSLCGGIGQLAVELDWPRSSVFRLNEVGFYFRIVDGQQPDRIFPLAPITGKVTGQRVKFFFIWLDGHPSTQMPLKLEAEVFAVNKGLEIGAPRRFRIRDARAR